MVVCVYRCSARVSKARKELGLEMSAVKKDGRHFDNERRV